VSARLIIVGSLNAPFISNTILMVSLISIEEINIVLFELLVPSFTKQIPTL
jgi:hypothetical protein